MEYSNEEYEKLHDKEKAVELVSKERSRIRKQCNPGGAVGYLLETLHLNAASMDMGLNIWQYNHPPIRI